MLISTVVNRTILFTPLFVTVFMPLPKPNSSLISPIQQSRRSHCRPHLPPWHQGKRKGSEWAPFGFPECNRSPHPWRSSETSLCVDCAVAAVPHDVCAIVPIYKLWRFTSSFSFLFSLRESYTPCSSLSPLLSLDNQSRFCRRRQPCHHKGSIDVCLSFLLPEGFISTHDYVPHQRHTGWTLKIPIGNFLACQLV